MTKRIIMVKVERVSKKYHDDSGELTVLRDVTFTIERGEMISLIGVSGAGKTTLLQIVGGLDSVTEGDVIVDGRNLGRMKPRELAAFRSLFIGFVFQFHHLLPDFTAIENTILPGLIAGKSRAECMDRGRELLASVGLEGRRSHYPSELSGGERQRVALARALFNRPALVLADEPTGNLDRENGKRLLELFHKTNGESGQTFLVATHNDELSQGMNRKLYLEDGIIAGK